MPDVPQDCAQCADPLYIEVEPDSDIDMDDGKAKAEAVTQVPDDVELSCGCHYHWECFLNAYSITECPKCSKNISSLDGSGKQQVLVTIKSEGGTQSNFDILPTATEEAYLRAFPEERRGHAYLEFCREGDLDAVVNLLKAAGGDESDSDGDGGNTDLIRYTGTFEGVDGSGLHVAIRHNQKEIAWLQLVLGTTTDWSRFPVRVQKAFTEFGLDQEDRTVGEDIRTLKDSEGRTPFDIAQEVGGEWEAWITNGYLDAPASDSEDATGASPR